MSVDPTLVIFFGNEILKKLQVSDQQTLVIFLTFFEKNYDWIKGDSAKSKTKWTGLYFQINLWLMEHLTPPCVPVSPHHAVLFCAYIISSVNQSSGVGKIKKISQLSWLDDLCLVRQKYDIL